MKIDERKIQEVRDYFTKKADLQIVQMKNTAEKEDRELSDEEIGAVKKGALIQAESRISQIRDLGPERLFKMGFALETVGWRAGYTKPTVAARAAKRRKNKKAGKASRRFNRKNK